MLRERITQKIKCLIERIEFWKYKMCCFLKLFESFLVIDLEYDFLLVGFIEFLYQFI
jgi:hypothetical protein